ncbi:Alpha/Beta hydrolase protein [Stachybotrys elegans]|uniref:Alpha/Beta hydrolase protein n=1 Tax=Stachybotrys elegans TaxID=80388 RepID=A0A8K0ST00_9HYPO|nr:Alpha/Beta hydrolase protein [Stachybotrys elegans]
MTMKEIVQYARWKSPLSCEAATARTRVISSPRVNIKSGRAFFTETQLDGRITLMEITHDGLVEVLPPSYSMSSKTDEYGHTAFDVLSDDRLIFSNKDGTVCVLDPNDSSITVLAAHPLLRYSGFAANMTSQWVLGIEEDRTHGSPKRIRNRLVAIHADSGQVSILTRTAEFYSSPNFSYDGTKIAWVEWNDLSQPFDAAQLYTALWDPRGLISNIELIAGHERESVAEPRWSPDGSLFFCKEEGEHRQLFRVQPGASVAAQIRAPCLENAEIGGIHLFEGSRTYAPLSERHLVASVARYGVCQLVCIDLATGACGILAGPDAMCLIRRDAVARLSESSALVIATGTRSTVALYEVDIYTPDAGKVIRTSTDAVHPQTLLPSLERMTIQPTGAPLRTMHGCLWMPRNPNSIAPVGDFPALIISFFTSRGFACFTVDPTGSSGGYGMTYRRKVFGQWGIIDADDLAECARHLIQTGLVKHDGVGVIGCGAGGYTALQALVRYPSMFAGGACISGISDLKRFHYTTDKRESVLASALVSASDDARRDCVYRERSPLFYADRIQAPVLLIHGKTNTIVSIEQARLMADALHKSGSEAKLVEITGDEHIFSAPASAALCLEEEEQWWRQTLL